MYAVFVLNEIMAYVRHKDSKAYAVYLDFFEKVNRTKLLFKLMYNINREIWLLIKNFDANLLLFVHKQRPNLGAFLFDSRSKIVNHRGPASPDLFNDYINKLIVM